MKRFLPISLIVAAFFGINLSQIDRYGESPDEMAAESRAQWTRTHVLSFLRSGKSERELRAPNVEHHPSFYATLNHGVSVLLNRTLGLPPPASGHFLTLFVASLGLLVLFLFTEKLLGKDVALYAAGFLALYPRWIAHAHYNPKDIPVAVFALACLFFLHRAFREGKRLFWWLGGIFCGTSIVTKLDGLWVIPIFFLAAVCAACFDSQKPSLKAFLVGSAIFFVSAGITTYLLWPYLWGHPGFLVESVRYFLENPVGPPEILYLGKTHPPGQLPWHYLPVFLLVVTPLITLIFFLWGLSVALRAGRRFEWILLLIWLGLPMVARWIPGVIQYNGIRHIFLVIPVLAILAGMGLDQLLSFIRKRLPETSHRNIQAVVMLVAAGWLAVEIIEVHPYQGSYFNRALRWCIPSHIEKIFPMDEWGGAYPEGVVWLNRHAKPNAVIRVIPFPHLVRWPLKRTDLVFTQSDDFDYLMALTSHTSFVPKLAKAYLENPNLTPLFTVQRYRSDLLRIYPAS